MNILGIETSCDETSASVVRDGTEILSNIVATQFEFHEEYAGVVPEIASRRHSEVINYVIERALKEAEAGFEDIDAVAVSSYPGLIGSLLVGLITAKTISYTRGIPLIGINHIEAHLYSVHYNNEPEYPTLALIISGGHTLLLLSQRIGEYEILGSTLDDAAGEAFDKVSKHLGLGYPGGPEIEKVAAKGDEDAYAFPVVTLKGNRDRDRYNFSYSGLKNAVINQRDRFLNPGSKPSVENIAASFQKAATDVLLIKAHYAAEDFGIRRVAVAGGVANNSRLRTIFGEAEGLRSYFPPRELTQDNAAMVAGLAFHKYMQGERASLDLEPRSRLENVVKGKRKRNGN
ncbi:MAG TPA: tRNA (adenosine(37)-N6)-threonylcarbamoyltransferase complex transferase subunit TsaD [Spirochaetota bacterium]|nr:tRNA (adenosine(37)-N6)-threonylcarbamoyltransferase complex transferase subunit TsaD [Spirochaetota bacterium]